jgi:hypothetical protein
LVSRAPFLVLLAGLAGLLLAGCGGGAVRIEVPPVSGKTLEVCAALHRALPPSLDGHERQPARPVRAGRPSGPGQDLVAAWGNPAIILRCGVGLPGAFRATSELAVVNGVDWFPERLSNGYLFTTIGREVGVELTVPADYAPEVNPLADLATTVARVVPVSAGRSSGSAPG